MASSTTLIPLHFLTCTTSVPSPCKHAFLAKASSSPAIATPSSFPANQIIVDDDTRTQSPTKKKSTSSSPATKRVPPIRTPSLVATLCGVADDFINNFMEVSLPPFMDPKHVLSGNFAPVADYPPVECSGIQGTLPRCLNGIYIRNGPNPRFVPRGAYHLFDGDGMLHSLRIKDGKATFSSRYVRTHKLLQEESAGRQLFPNAFSGLNGTAGLARIAVSALRSALGELNMSNGTGLANTSVVFFNNKLMAMAESDAPYIIRATNEGDVRTIRRHDFDGSLFMGMTAHPKIDPETGELFAFRYAPMHPFLNFFRVSPDGTKSPDVGLTSLTQLSFIHDFAITKKYAVFPDTQIVMNPMKMVTEAGSLITHDAAKVPRIGVIPRYAETDAEMKWIDVPGFNFIHSLNAWDEGDDEVVLVAANPTPLEHAIGQTELARPAVEKVRINLRTGKVTRKALSSRCLEFGVINSKYVGKKNKFCYMAVGAPFPKICGVAKINFDEERVVSERIFPQGVYGGEPFFVASNTNGDEDDGYIVMYAHDELRRVSKFVVMDAQSPSLEIVASVELPSRVPYGFHGLFVPERDLARQFGSM